MASVDKIGLLRAVIEQIDVEIATMTRIAREAAEAASHEENRAEGIKDMRSTEASYVAKGQAARALELEHSRTRLIALELKTFSAAAAIESTALVQLLHRNRSTWYFILPAGGGRQISQAGVSYQTITPTSPLGSALLGLSVGDDAEVSTPTEIRFYEVLAIL